MLGMDLTGQLPCWITLILLLISSKVSHAVPGIYSLMKRDGIEEPVAKDNISAEAGQILQLRREIENMSKELLDTREQLERLKQDVGANTHKANVINPERFETRCRTEFTWWHETVGRTLEYLDNFDIHCRHGEFLRQWRMTWGERERKKAVRFVCCHFVLPSHLSSSSDSTTR